MEGNRVLFVVGDDLGALFETSNDAVDRIQEVLVRHEFPILARREQGRLVAHVGDVRTTESRGLFGQEIHVDGAVRFDGPEVHVKNGLPLIDIWHVHVNLSVESSSAHQSLVQRSPLGSWPPG